MIKRLYCAEHEITYYEGGACFYCKQNRERGPKSETQMVDDYRSYTLEVDLEKMPDGWLCFAIGEGKPCIAPPPVMDEIKALVSKLDRYENGDTKQWILDELELRSRIKELESQREIDEATAKRLTDDVAAHWKAKLDEEHKDAMKWSGIAGAQTNKANGLEERVRETERSLKLHQDEIAAQVEHRLAAERERNELQSRLDRALKIGEEREQSVDRLLAERDELRFRLGAIREALSRAGYDAKFDERELTAQGIDLRQIPELRVINEIWKMLWHDAETVVETGLVKNEAMSRIHGCDTYVVGMWPNCGCEHPSACQHNPDRVVERVCARCGVGEIVVVEGQLRCTMCGLDYESRAVETPHE